MSNEPQTAMDTFKAWHRTEKLWMDIYTRAVASLIAALVIYLVAVLAGVAPKRPAYIALPLAALAGVWLAHLRVPWVDDTPRRKLIFALMILTITGAGTVWIYATR